IRALAMRGHGVALLPNSVFHMDTSDKKLVRVLPEWATPEEPLHLVYPAQRFSSPKLREMLPILDRDLREVVDACFALRRAVCQTAMDSTAFSRAVSFIAGSATPSTRNVVTSVMPRNPRTARR